jgi:mycothiol synthase
MNANEKPSRQLFMRRPDFLGLPAMPSLPPGYELRTARDADDQAIADVMSSAFGPDWSAARVHRDLLDADDVKETFVVAAQGVPVATASARLMPEDYPDSGYLHWVAVHAGQRGKQLGRVVTLAVLDYFRAVGCRDAVLETDPPRLPAIRVYLGLGFRPEYVAPEHEAVWRGIFAELGTRSGPDSARVG